MSIHVDNSQTEDESNGEETGWYKKTYWQCQIGFWQSHKHNEMLKYHDRTASGVCKKQMFIKCIKEKLGHQ